MRRNDKPPRNISRSATAMTVLRPSSLPEGKSCGHPSRFGHAIQTRTASAQVTF